MAQERRAQPLAVGKSRSDVVLRVLHSLALGDFDLAGDDHAAEVLVRRHLPDAYAARRLEADRAAMAVARHALHPPFQVARVHAEFVFERAARPQRRGLLVLRHADALALEIGWLI